MKVPYASSFEEDGYLDDGDLPSLTPKGSGSFGSQNAAPKLKSSTGQRQFWDQLDGGDSLSGADANEHVLVATGPRNFHPLVEDDGPDDEMAARRALVTAEAKQVRSFESENSAPTENESQLTEEVEEETYETSFCGQTLNAIDDMCGGNLHLTGDRTNHKRSATTSPPVDRTRMGSLSPLAATHRLSEAQQENTAIEVEFVEPIQSTKSMDSQGGGSTSERKNLRLNALAKRAKENFRNKRGKKSQSPKIAVHATGGSIAEHEEEAVSAREIGSPVEDTVRPPVTQDAPMHLDDLEEQDYNAFNATEKRKFIKLINSGVTSAVATRQILDDRLHQPENEPNHLHREVDADSLDREMNEEEDDIATESVPISGPLDVSDGGDSVPFQKSGNVYYDAVRRDAEDEQEIVEISSRGSSGFKGLELGAVQRFFQSGKHKGFSPLADTPQRRPVSAPSQQLMQEEDDNLMETSRGSDILESEHAGSLAVNASLENLPEETGANISNNSFDSLVRRRLVHDTENDVSMDTGNVSAINDSVNEDVSQPVVSESFVAPPAESRSLPLSNALNRSMDERITEPSDLMQEFDHSALQRSKSVDSALNSTMESYSVQVDPLAHHNDAVSVYTTGTSVATGAHHNDAVSVYTTGTSVATGATTHTQSSRVRRPGVAKVRLAKQKELEQTAAKKRQGWHETIRVAAASTNRTWDPKKGWVDYAEPDMVAADFDSKKEPIKIDLSRSILSHKDDSASKDVSGELSVPAVPVPFPEEWEKEREAMLRSSPEIAAKISRQAQVDDVVVMTEENDLPSDVVAGTAVVNTGDNYTMDVSQLSRSLGKDSLDESNTNAWVESMRAASAALASEGMTWDPKYGWQQSTDDGRDVPSTVGRQMSPEMDIGSCEVPDTVDFDIPLKVNMEPAPSIPTTTVEIDPIELETKKIALEIKKIAPVASNDVVPKTRRWFGRRAPSEPSNLNIVSVEGTNDTTIPAVISGPFESTERMRSEEKDEVDIFDSNVNGLHDDIVILEPGSDGESTRNVVEVVKLKVNDDDLELFPRTLGTLNHADLSLKASPAPWNPIRSVPSTDPQANVSILSNDPSSVSSRRGAGPVDTDEVDETWDSDDEERRSKGWLPDIPDPMKRDVSVERHNIDSWKDGALTAPRNNSKSVPSPTYGSDGGRSAGVGSATPGSSVDASSSKQIPKLQRSKRDTSPLSLRGPMDGSFPRPTDSIERQENIPQTVPVVSLAAVEPKISPPSGKPEAPISGEAPAIAAPRRSVEPLSPNSNLVQARLKEWESRIESSHSTDAGDTVEATRISGLVPSVVAGWKSFLSKKVEKTMAEASTKDLSQGVTDPVRQPVPLTRGKPSDDDTLFQFGEKPEVAALNLSDLSPIQATGDVSDDDDIATSEAYGPTEAQRKSASFLDRLTECATPMMPTRPMCGGKLEEDTIVGGVDAHRRSQSFGDDKPPSYAAAPQTFSTSSVVSEDFGAKTAFLDALAMKAAVSKPKRSRRTDASGGAGSSVVSSSGTDHSEQWQRFLERKKAAGSSPVTSRVSDAQLSQAAEKYASEKVEEIISKMSARSNTAPRSRDVRSPSIGDPVPPNRGPSMAAAEDLAAARVEAMMAALSTSQMDEGEI